MESSERWHLRLPRIRWRALIHRIDHPLFVMLRHWIDVRDPIVRAEITRPLPLPTLDRKVFNSRAGRLFLRLLSEGTSALGCLLMPLFFVGPFLPWFWRIPTLVSTGPLIARELEQRTWATLRTTPYSTKEIIQALHAAGTSRVGFIWAYVTSMRMAIVGILAIIMVILAWSPGRDRIQVGLIEWVAYIGCAAYLLLEPLLDVAVDGALGLLGSTFSRSQLMGALNALILRLILWGVQLMTLVLILPIANVALAPKLAHNVPSLVIFGPAYGLTLGFSPETTLFFIITVTVARLIWLQVLISVTAWRAARVQE